MNRHSYTCHIRFSDVDIYRHVNNVKYFEYYQEARLALLGSLGWSGDGGGFAVVVARIKVDYKRPILFRTEPYTVETRVKDVGTSSYTLDAEIKDGDQVLSRAEVVMVAFDLGSRRSRQLTDDERGLLLDAIEE